MPDCSMFATAMQLGGRLSSAVDLSTGEVFGPHGAASRGFLREQGVPCVPVRSAAAHLSKVHISTLESAVAAPEVESGPKVYGWAAGTLFKIKRSTEPGQAPEGGKRGKITEFSRAARRRLMYRVATIQRDKLPLFVTLTYPDEFPHEPAEWSKHFERLRSRLARRGYGAIWRRELKIRQSGEKNVGRVAPHYHLLIWGADLWKLHDYLPVAWHQIAGAGDLNHLLWHQGKLGGENKHCVQKSATWRGVSSYVGKYIAKLETLPEVEGWPSLGRFWGIINADVIPWDEAIEMSVSGSVASTLFRYMRRYAHMKARGSASLTIMCNDPWRWLQAAESHSRTGP